MQFEFCSVKLCVSSVFANILFFHDLKKVFFFRVISSDKTKEKKGTFWKLEKQKKKKERRKEIFRFSLFA